jgi:hypothetical protein
MDRSVRRWLVVGMIALAGVAGSAALGAGLKAQTLPRVIIQTALGNI